VNRVSGYAQVFLGATVAQLVAGYLLVEAWGIAAFPITGAVASLGVFMYLLMKIQSQATKPAAKQSSDRSGAVSKIDK